MKSNLFGVDVSTLDSSQLKQLDLAIQEAKYRKRLGFSTYAELAQLYRNHPRYPECHNEATHKDGYTSQGLRRFVCPRCGRGYNQLSGTIFESAKLPLVIWLQFLDLMIKNIPIDAISDLVGKSVQTAFEWRHGGLSEV